MYLVCYVLLLLATLLAVVDARTPDVADCRGLSRVIEFADDHDGCLFTATVTRKPVDALDLVEADAPKSLDEPKNKPKTDPDGKILEIIGSRPDVSYDELAELIRKGRSSIMPQIAKLKALGRLKRVGPKKGGHWEVIE